MKRDASYIRLFESGELARRAEALEKIVRSCALCPHRCGVDRTRSKAGRCRSGALPVISSFHAHFGEESPLVGRSGSGTIFFTNCNLACIFCQNYDISHLGRGEEISTGDLARVMLLLQNKGCHNINLVTPTHMTHAIVRALLEAVPQGLRLPLVYNCGGFESLETLHLLEDVIDIYMPDFKYMDADTGLRLSGAGDYPSVAAQAVAEMHRQVGDLLLDESGIAVRGLLVRHLVLPNNLASTDRVVDFIAGLSRDSYLNIMDQYRPEYRARECADLRRRVTLQEFDEAILHARRAGLRRLDKYR